MRSRQLAMGALTGVLAAVGGWAQLAPASFYRAFPAGRAWVAADGPYNEHLVRDVGGLMLALCVVTGVAAWRARPGLLRLAAVATLVSGVPHLAYHAAHLHLYGAADVVGNLVALGLGVAIPAWVALSPAPRTPAATAVAARRTMHQ
jgi:hypothetical protein